MENNKQQTAAEWMLNELRQLAFDKPHHLGLGDIRVTQGYLDELEEKAKEMEAESIYNERAFWFGRGILAAKEGNIDELRPRK